MIFERALKELPGSYKLWIRYLRLRVEQTKSRSILDPIYRDTNNCFERALVFMHKMPRIWIEYLQLLVHESLITTTRRVFDRALQSLPVTQHNRIWPMYLKLIKMHNVPETAVRVYKRYLRLQPEEAEKFIEYLKSIGNLDEAAQKLAEIVNDEHFVSKEGKSRYQLWSELCEMVSKNPDKITSLNVEAIIREGIKRYTDQQGRLWNSLAEFFARSGLFEKSRDVYEEAIQSVSTIRDFSVVFDAFAQSEERLVNALMESDLDDDTELELRLARYEALIERRPILLNSVVLRQNPHNVDEWHKRVKLLEGKPLEIIETFTDAVQTVDASQAIGKVSSLWIEFAKFYESKGQLDDSRIIFQKGTQAHLTKVEELAAIWCEWAEMELRSHKPKEALRLMEKATAAPAKKTSYFDESQTVQDRVYKSLKVWSMYADLEESFGSFRSTKAVYERIIELKIATPQIIINYGMYLEENNYFEEAFKAYEKGIELFRWPMVHDIWNTYLTKFLTRYGGSKLERARDLFEQCLEKCPPKLAKNFYLLYAKLEEDHGLAKRSMAVYDRATLGVQKSDQMQMFSLYIGKATQLFGITSTRQIFEKAIDVLPDSDAREICLRFADMERKLGEIDRARAIYSHASQFSDPRLTPSFWNIWKEFEIKHGNEDTIREMLRIKRSIQATFNTQVNFMSAQMVAATSSTNASDLLSQTMETELQDSEDMTASEPAAAATLPEKSKKEMLFVRSTKKDIAEEIPTEDESQEEGTQDENQEPKREYWLKWRIVFNCAIIFRWNQN